MAGGVLMTIGNLMLVIPGPFRAVLRRPGVIVLGVGCSSPTSRPWSRMLYPKAAAGAMPASTIFYMGINLGAFIGPLIAGWLALKYGWRIRLLAGGRRHAARARAVLAVAKPAPRPRGMRRTGRTAARASVATGWCSALRLRCSRSAAFLLQLSGHRRRNPAPLAKAGRVRPGRHGAAYFLYLFFGAG